MISPLSKKISPNKKNNVPAEVKNKNEKEKIELDIEKLIK
jgi:hypothetical protein